MDDIYRVTVAKRMIKLRIAPQSILNVIFQNEWPYLKKTTPHLELIDDQSAMYVALRVKGLQMHSRSQQSSPLLSQPHQQERSSDVRKYQYHITTGGK